LQAQYTFLKLPTYFPEREFWQFSRLLGLPFTPEQTEVEFYTSQPLENLEKQEGLELTHFLEERMQLAKYWHKPVWLFGGMNSSLKHMKEVLLETYDSSEVLILGETGSLTKIISKAKRNFVGVVALKINNLEYVLNQASEVSMSEIWLVNQPYLFIHEYWKQIARQTNDMQGYLDKFKQFYLLSKLYKIYSLTGLEPKFLRSYQV
jgi:hypothetical protein